MKKFEIYYYDRELKKDDVAIIEAESQGEALTMFEEGMDGLIGEGDISEVKEVIENFRKLGKREVKNMINNGWKYNLIYCGSKQTPLRNPEIKLNTISTDYFYKMSHFEKWCERQKDKICNEFAGATIKFYLILKD